MKIYYDMPKSITPNKETFHLLTCMYETFDKTSHEELHLDFKNTRFIEPNMMSPLGMIFNKLKSNQNEIYLSNLREPIKRMLLKFDFIHLDYADTNMPQNFIKYANFNGDEVEKYRTYLYDQLQDIKNSEIVSLLISNIMEIFINVKMHARSNFTRSEYGNNEIFSSGYYNKNQNYILFSISNNGWTFTENIKKRLNINYENDVSYIKWALQSLNSTTDEERPGGVGLKKLIELINETYGTIVICSGKGFFSMKAEKDNTDTIEGDLVNYFPGTSITVKIPINGTLENLTVKIVEEISVEELIMEEKVDVHNLLLER